MNLCLFQWNDVHFYLIFLFALCIIYYYYALICAFRMCPLILHRLPSLSLNRQSAKSRVSFPQRKHGCDLWRPEHSPVICLSFVPNLHVFLIKIRVCGFSLLSPLLRLSRGCIWQLRVWRPRPHRRPRPLYSVSQAPEPCSLHLDGLHPPADLFVFLYVSWVLKLVSLHRWTNLANSSNCPHPGVVTRPTLYPLYRLRQIQSNLLHSSATIKSGWYP